VLVGWNRRSRGLAPRGSEGRPRRALRGGPGRKRRKSRGRRRVRPVGLGTGRACSRGAGLAGPQTVPQEFVALVHRICGVEAPSFSGERKRRLLPFSELSVVLRVGTAGYAVGAQGPWAV
jgi:hypothetical protein